MTYSTKLTFLLIIFNLLFSHERFCQNPSIQELYKITHVPPYAASLGKYGEYPVSYYTTEQTFSGGKNTSTTVTGSANASITATPIGVHTTLESTRNENGTTNTFRIAPFNFGLTYGVVVVGEFNLDLGLKMTWKND